MDLPAVMAQAQVDAQTRVYACGPQRLIDELQALAERWPEGVLHVEHFHAEAGALDPSREHGFVAELRHSGLQVPVPQARLLRPRKTRRRRKRPKQRQRRKPKPPGQKRPRRRQRVPNAHEPKPRASRRRTRHCCNS